MLKSRTLVVVFFVFVFLWAPSCVFAAFNLSLRPFEGGSDLKFGRVRNFGPTAGKELIVNIDVDNGKPYQIVQTLLEPLANDQGARLDTGCLTVYGVMGSNRQGTVSVQAETSVSLSRTIIYTSSPQGLSDSFNLVYVVKGGCGAPSGSYRGRIAFTLEPIGSSEPPVTVILNMFADIEAEAGVDIKTVTGSKIISLSTQRAEGRSADVLFDVKGDRGVPFQILQTLKEPWTSQDGKALADDAVTFQLSDVKKGSGPVQPVVLSKRSDVVYTSSQAGEADTFVLTYRVAEKDDVLAGTYKTRIGYFLQSGAARNPLETLECEVEIARQFDLNVTPETGGMIQFHDLKAQEPPKQSEVVIDIKSNIGKPYQVSQQLVSALVNKEGQAIPEKNFTLKEESIGTKGTLPFLSGPKSVKAGELVLFVSDKAGSSDQFKVVYELSPSIEIPAGDYAARVMYSISEI